MDVNAAASHAADLDLARRAIAGDATARKGFADRMGCVPRILSAMNRRLSHPVPPHDLEDLTQDTLVTIWRRLDTYRGMAKIETWAYRFCYFELSNRLAAIRRKPRFLDVKDADVVSEALVACHEHEAVHQALDQLEASTADLIRLKCFEQWNFKELGRRLDASPNTVKARYYRGLAKLRTILEPEQLDSRQREAEQ